MDLGETPIARASSVRLSNAGGTLGVDVALSGSLGFFFIVFASCCDKLQD